MLCLKASNFNDELSINRFLKDYLQIRINLIDKLME